MPDYIEHEREPAYTIVTSTFASSMRLAGDSVESSWSQIVSALIIDKSIEFKNVRTERLLKGAAAPYAQIS